MKTIKQIAEELGVSKTAVRKYLTDEVKTKFAQTVSGIIYIDEQGETLIKSSFDKNKPQTKFPDVSANKISEVSSEVSALISMLQRELEIKNKQIEELTATIKLQAESINADRKNELVGTLIDGQKNLLGEHEQGMDTVITSERCDRNRRKKDFLIFSRDSYFKCFLTSLVARRIR